MNTQFIDHFIPTSPARAAQFKVAYFRELAKKRSADPLFELKKLEGHKFTPDESFMEEIKEMRAKLDAEMS